jgi:predicted DNA-binding antitoxin AbrB/MazE fold protein
MKFKTGKRKQIGVKVNEEIWKDLKILAIHKDKTATELLNDVMEEYLKDHHKKLES